MVTWHERSARAEFLDAIELKGVDWAYKIVEVGRQAIWCERYDTCNHHAEAAVIGQTHRGDETLEQTYCRGLIGSMIVEGRVRRSFQRIGAMPKPDRERRRNRQALTDGLSDSGLTAEVWAPGQGDPGEDGWVEWSEPLSVFRLPDAQAAEGDPLQLGPGGAPLEIGYTLPSRTLGHLAHDGAVWRWPYDSELLWIGAAVDQTSARNERLLPLYLDGRWLDPTAPVTSAST